MSSVAIPEQTFHANVADLYGDRTNVVPFTADRQIVRKTIVSVVQRAKAAMAPVLHGRIDKGMALVLAGDVELFPDGKAHVASQSNGQAAYFVVKGCDNLWSEKLREGVRRETAVLFFGYR